MEVIAVHRDKEVGLDMLHFPISSYQAWAMQTPIIQPCHNVELVWVI